MSVIASVSVSVCVCVCGNLELPSVRQVCVCVCVQCVAACGSVLQCVAGQPRSPLRTPGITHELTRHELKRHEPNETPDLKN